MSKIGTIKNFFGQVQDPNKSSHSAHPGRRVGRVEGLAAYSLWG